MSTAVDVAPEPSSPDTGTPTDGPGLPALGDPAERGSLTVADRVVERVAGHAVTLVEGASAAPRRVLGVSVGESRDDRAASVDARVDGHVATVAASVAVGWPASVRTVADRLRRQVRDDVERITGVRVAHVDIDVVSLSAPPSARRRVQ
ncbi:Asp23/Gls24 family envelope stress response protein [Blastococcus sp. TF02-09]|uniref:Asp23/Gls24 family envelope stress response protein n=1 Tax=Blastococcus sp. TF02-09 TaxID=2250576 RepID=UPI000DE969A9|nr:Asp23/Gls24 family envelope stress response protein [Blastococcus sp. TF02-9]RBY80364.1 Asp23/Gls24 family envelope stress response protein [Blastococcus sp. TF02-9]